MAGRTVGLHAGHQGTVILGGARRKVQRVGHRGVHRLRLHADIAAGDVTRPLELGHHALDRVGRDGEADTHAAAAVRRDDGAVDAHHLAVLGEQRSARVALVDRCVDLQEAVVIALADVAPTRADDAGGHRAAQAERVAHGDHPCTRLRSVGIAKVDERQRMIRLHAQHGEVGRLVAADHPGRQHGAVIHRDGDRGRTAHHVVVRHDGAVGVDQEPRTARFHQALALLLLRHGEREAERETLAMTEARHAAALAVLLLLRANLAGDRHHGRLHLMHQLHKIRQRMADLAGIDGARLGLHHAGVALGMGAGGQAGQAEAAYSRAGQQREGQGSATPGCAVHHRWNSNFARQTSPADLLQYRRRTDRFIVATVKPLS